MPFKKIVILFLTFLICSCSPTRNDFYLGETGVHGWMEVTFVEYHITPINTDEFYLDYTLHLNMENNFPYKLKISETYVHGYWDPATNYNEAYEPQKMYTCNINKNIEKNGYDIFAKENIAGDYSYTFFVKLPNTIYKEQGKIKEEANFIDIYFAGFCFRTCTREYIESLKSNF